MTKHTPWRWAHVALAALAMTATLPGRTHGLGLFTKPIRLEFDIDFDSYGTLNMFATLIGGLFCFPCGWLLDRVGTRYVLTTIALALGATVVIMSRTAGHGWIYLGQSLAFPLDLFILILLTRGFGQSALSVASLSLIARSTGQRQGLAMGVYGFLTTIGFIAAFTILRSVIKADPNNWRVQWAGIGVAVAACGAVFYLLVRDSVLDEKPATTDARPSGSTLGQALRSPVFWVFALATSFYGMVVAGTSLFNEDLLAERGLDKEVFLNATVVGIRAGLVANLLGGWLATRVSLSYLLAAALGLLAATLMWFPHLHHEEEVYVYTVALAAAGGVITIVFFTVWRPAFGLSHLGRIQGAAQFLTVVFSAIGPKLLGSAHSHLGSFGVVFPYLAGFAALLAVVAALTRLPVKESA